MKMKKLLAALLAAVMVIGAMPVGVFAADPQSDPTSSSGESTDYSWTVGMSVVFPDDQDLVLYKNASTGSQTQVVPAANLRYVDAKVKRYVVDSDGLLWFELTYDVTGRGIPNKKCTYMIGSGVALTNDPNPVREVTAAADGKTFTVVGRMPNGVSLSVTPVNASAYADELTGIAVPYAGYDISLMNGTQEFEPLTAAYVTIDGITAPSEPVRVFHLTNSDTENFAYTAAQNITYDAAGHKVGFKADSFSVYLIVEDSDIIAHINAELHLSTFNPIIYTYTAGSKDKSGSLSLEDDLDAADVSINGTVFVDYFYYNEVTSDPDAQPVFGTNPETAAQTYAAYLVQTYLNTFDAVYPAQEAELGPTDGAVAADIAALAAVREIWNKYIYDIFDPEYRWMNDTDYYKHYVPNSMGDKGFEWPKSEQKYSSFHFADKMLNKIVPLEYNHLEHGVDYENFVTKVSKTATVPDADHAGDNNAQRQYDIVVTADAQAKVKAPVVLIFQIQTAWQLFDLEHANKKKVNDKNSPYIDDNTEVGAVADNTSLVTLYQIKHALLKFVDEMDELYPGNNLFIGITETKHDQSTTMFVDGSYVTNNLTYLREGITNWDVFGNCEHVHYDSEALEDAVRNLSSDLAGLTDKDDNPIPYDQMSKAVVVVGGPTENTNGTNGYACPLPWSTFRTNEIDAVYGIRVNQGTSYVTSGTEAGVISWLDYSSNHYGEPYALTPSDTQTDAKGGGDANDKGNFTRYYDDIWNEEDFIDALREIALEQMNAKGLDVQSPEVHVENLTLTDTVTDEFVLDTSKEMYVVLTDADGEELIDRIPYDPTDSHWVYTENSDGTFTVTYTFDTVYNTQYAKLYIPVIAKEDYIGSNNVKTNVGTPCVTYEHQVPDSDEVINPLVECYDTPEVNVPIRFTTEDGGSTAIWVGDTVDLATLDPETIMADCIDRIDNYDQINGTVTFAWKLSDGYVWPITGGIPVTNGTWNTADMPDLTHEQTFTKVGHFVEQLIVTFTPDTVKDNGQFSNTDTKIAVSELPLPGNVTIDVIQPGEVVDYYVRKTWTEDETIDHSNDAIDWQLYANDEPFLRVIENESEVESGYVTGTLSPENGWQMKVTNLPKAIDDGAGHPIVLKYQAVETNGKFGYEPDYTMTTQTDEQWTGFLKLDVTSNTSVNLNDAKFVHIDFTYAGNHYSYDYALDQTKNNKQQLPAKSDANNTRTASIVLDHTGVNEPRIYTNLYPEGETTPSTLDYVTEPLEFPVTPDGQPMSGVVINECFVYQELKLADVNVKINNKDVKVKRAQFTNQYWLYDNTGTHTISCASVAVSVDPRLLGSVTTDVFVIDNTLVHELKTSDVVVIDYGIPVNINVIANDNVVGTGEIIGISAVEPDVKALELFNELDMVYGTAALNEDGTITYALNDMAMTDVETLYYILRVTDETGNVFVFYAAATVVPATVIYFEDSFVTFSDEWETVGAEDGRVQAEDRPGSSEKNDADNPYGYDGIYTDFNTYSYGLSRKVTVSKGMTAWPTATFTFTGSAFDLIGLTGKNTGSAKVRVDDADGRKVASWIVDTFYGYKSVNADLLYKDIYQYNAREERWGISRVVVADMTLEDDETLITELPDDPVPMKKYIMFSEGREWVLSDEDVDLYQIPVIKSGDLGYGTYTVTVTPIWSATSDHNNADGSNSYDFYLDAIRVYSPADESDEVVEYYKADGEAWPQFVEIRKCLLDQDDFTADETAANGIVFIDGYGADGDITAYNNFGPNHETYLMGGQAVSFSLNAKGSSIVSVQISAKAVNGSVSLLVSGKTSMMKDLASSTDVYYDITGLVSWNGTESGIITIANPAEDDSILSITNIKITFTEEPEEPAPVMLFSTAANGRAAAAGLFMMLRTAPAPVVEELPAEEPIEEPEVEAFVPAFIKIGTALKPNGKKTVVTVTTSGDVEAVLINGENAALKKTNEKNGRKTWKLDVSNGATITVIAVNADGIASAPYGDADIETPVFVPTLLKITTELKGNGKKTTVTVKTFDDVKSLQINGKNATLKKTNDENGKLTWKIDITTGESVTVIAVDADGIASAPVTTDPASTTIG